MSIWPKNLSVVLSSGLFSSFYWHQSLRLISTTLTNHRRPLIGFAKPAASEVLTCHLQNNGCPPWTSYFVRYDAIIDDQWGRSHFNWPVNNGASNYHILRTGCYPYIKYHCSKRPVQDLRIEDAFFRFIKVFNLGLPCLAYGTAARFLIKHEEIVVTPKGNVTIYFLYEENKGSSF